jgi:hypothetical protein
MSCDARQCIKIRGLLYSRILTILTLPAIGQRRALLRVVALLKALYKLNECGLTFASNAVVHLGIQQALSRHVGRMHATPDNLRSGKHLANEAGDHPCRSGFNCQHGQADDLGLLLTKNLSDFPPNVMVGVLQSPMIRNVSCRAILKNRSFVELGSWLVRCRIIGIVDYGLMPCGKQTPRKIPYAKGKVVNVSRPTKPRERWPDKEYLHVLRVMLKMLFLLASLKHRGRNRHLNALYL